MLKLRPYQEEIINGLRISIANGNKRLVLCAPTGSGKSAMFSFIAKNHIAKGGKALILCDRIELMSQANGTFDRLGLNPEVIKAGHVPDLTANLHVGMIETLYRRAEKYKSFLDSRTLIIADECHKTTFSKIFPYLSDSAIVLGCTATPHRQGNQPSMDEYYTDIVQKIDTPDLIQRGFLSEANSYGVDTDLTGIKKKGGDFDSKQIGDRFSQNKVYEGVIENYQRICPNTKALAFAANVASSMELSQKFSGAGIPSKHLDGTMGKVERESILKWFENSSRGVLVNCAVLTTGFDCPSIETVILYRATTSLPLMLQMVGRGSRVTDSKRKFTILDFGSNIKRHGLWEAERTWSLEKKKKKTKQDAPAVKDCPKCNALIPTSAKICTYCGHVFKKSKKEQQQEEIAELQLLPKSDRMAKALQGTTEDKVKMAKAKLIHPFWVLHNMTDKDEAIEFVKKMGWKRGFIHLNKQKFEVFQ